MELGKGTDCNFCAHWKQYHGPDYTDLSSVKIYFLDTCDNPGTFEDDYAGLKKVEESRGEVDGKHGQSNCHGCPSGVQ